MKRLIMLKSIGMTGKSYTVKALMDAHPDWVHMHQSNREYFKLHPEVKPEEVDELDLYNYFAEKLFSEKIKNTTYITERTPFDYLIHNEYRHFFKMDLNNFNFPDGTNYIKRIYEDEHRFLMQFDQVDIYVCFNMDLNWMNDYFHSIPKDDIHKIFYKGRGYMILYQDNWFKSFRNHIDIYTSLVDKLGSLNISYHEFWDFIQDATSFNQDLLSKYEHNLFQ